MCFRKKYRYRYWKILQYLDGILILPQYFSSLSIDIDIAVHFRYRYSLLFFGIGKNTVYNTYLPSFWNTNDSFLNTGKYFSDKYTWFKLRKNHPNRLEMAKYFAVKNFSKRHKKTCAIFLTDFLEYVAI